MRATELCHCASSLLRQVHVGLLSRRFFLLALLATAAMVCLAADTSWAARAPKSVSLGGTRINLQGPEGHIWINKKKEFAFSFIPARYAEVVKHIISMYSFSTQNSLDKIYNNHCCIFYIGPPEKKWTAEDFAELESYLLPEGKEPDPARTVVGGAFLRTLLQDGVGYSVSISRGERYFRDVQQGSVVDRSSLSAVAGKLHKRKKEKEKYIVLALALIQNKLIGMVYYQVTPDAEERERANATILNWQQALQAANR